VQLTADKETECWRSQTDAPILDRIHSLGRVLLAISTFVHPEKIENQKDLVPALEADEVVPGWVDYPRTSDHLVARGAPI